MGLLKAGPAEVCSCSPLKTKVVGDLVPVDACELAVDAELADDREEELVVVFFFSGHFDV